MKGSKEKLKLTTDRVKPLCGRVLQSRLLLAPSALPTMRRTSHGFDDGDDVYVTSRGVHLLETIVCKQREGWNT